MTIRELREALLRLAPKHDSMEFVIHLPGTKVDIDLPLLTPPIGDEVLVEGRLRPGSTLVQRP